MESCFLDCWKFLSVVVMFENFGDSPAAKNCLPVCLLSVVSKIFVVLVNNRPVDHFVNEASFLISSMVSGLLDQLYTLTVVSHRIGRAFKNLKIARAAQAVTPDIPGASDRVWHVCLLYKLISCFISNRQL